MKTRKKYRSLLLAALLCLSLAACGNQDGDKAGGDWRTTGVVDAYGTIARDGEEIDVCACLGPKALYFYYNNEKHELFDTAVLPTDELGDEDWQFGEMSLSDFQRRLQQRPAAHALSRGYERILHRVGVGKGRRLSLPAVRLLFPREPRGR